MLKYSHISVYFNKKIILLVILFLFFISFAIPTSLHAQWWAIGMGKRGDLRYGMGGLLGYNKLLKGYMDYKDTGFGGVEVKLFKEYLYQPSPMTYKISLECFPLIVTEGTYGLSERMYDLSLNTQYNFSKKSSLRFGKQQTAKIRNYQPFMGVGLGLYLDRITLETPTSGKLSENNLYFGFNISGGLEYKINKFWSISPEIRMHFVIETGGFLARHITFHTGLMYYFPTRKMVKHIKEKKEESLKETDQHFEDEDIDNMIFEEE